MPRYRGPRWQRATSEQRLLLLEGIGSRYWSPLTTDPRFVTFKYEDSKGKEHTLDRKRQLAAFKTLCKDPEALLEERLIAVGALDIDEQSMHVAVDIARPYIAQPDSRLHAKVVDLGAVPEKNEHDTEGKNIGAPWWRAFESAAVVLHHNITPRCDDDRWTLLRDLIERSTEATHIIVCAGLEPSDFMVDRLYMRPDVMLLTDGQSVRRQSR